MKRKVTSLWLITAVLLFLLAGCTGDSSSSNTGQANRNSSGTNSRNKKSIVETKSPDSFSYETDKNSTSSSSVKYKAKQILYSDTVLTGKTIISSKQNENVILVNRNSQVLLKNVTVSKKIKGASDTKKAGSCGTVSAILGISGTTCIKNSRITTAANNSSGIFSCGNSEIGVADSTIITEKKNSDGITASQIGTLYANNLKVSTKGPFSSPLVNNYGTLVVKGGTYTSTGKESPAVYSNFSTSIGYATVKANQSEATRIEGTGSVELYKTRLFGKKSSADKTNRDWNVILTKSASSYGDSCFYMEGGFLKAENSGMFYTENTSSRILLNNVNIKTTGKNRYFLKVIDKKRKMNQDTSNTNASTDCKLIAYDQKMTGDIIWDTGSKLDVRMKGCSTLAGAIIRNKRKSSKQNSYCRVSIGRNSIWIVTGNSRVTVLNNLGTIKDNLNKRVTLKDSYGRIFYKGNSKYSITTDSYYETGMTDTDTISFFDKSHDLSR